MVIKRNLVIFLVIILVCFLLTNSFVGLREQEKYYSIKNISSMNSICSKYNLRRCRKADYCRIINESRCEIYPNFDSIELDDNINEGVCIKGNYNNIKQNTTNKRLEMFQNRTSWMFKNWTKWNGNCIGITKNSSYHSGHREKDLYYINNFCISPLDGLSGYKPAVEEYLGQDETYDEYRERIYFAQFIQNVKNLSKEPECFLDTKVVIMPLPTLGEDNLGHTQLRIISLLKIISIVYPNTNDKEILVIFVKNTAKYKKNALSFFYQMINTSWASVSNPYSYKTKYKNNNKNTEEQNLCFKRAIVWQNCKDCNLTMNNGIQVGNSSQKYSYGMWSYNKHHLSLLNNLRQKTILCYDLKRKEIKRPMIAWDFRMITRFIHKFSYISFELEKKIMEMYSTPIFFRQIYSNQFTFRNYVRMIYNADILIGVHGAGLSQSFLLPPGSVLLEISFPFTKCNHSHPYFPHLCMFGIFTYPSGITHLIYNVRQKDIRKDGINLPFNALLKIVEISLCVYSRNGNCPDLQTTIDYVIDNPM
jgi:hypothetical protein